jgi:hypothetical protein
MTDKIYTEKDAYVSILEFITNTFYRTDDNEPITINLSTEAGSNYYNQKEIVLSEILIDQFGLMGLPRFLIYYHELGHHLYSQGLFRMEDAWIKIKQGPIAYDKKYRHLLNWIEDFYIEQKLVDEHSYLTDVINCIKKLKPEYPIDNLGYAFNYYYVHGAPTPALQYTDQLTFIAYIKKLLTLRQDGNTRFGYGILTTFSIKQSRETKFVLALIEFYNWCVSVGIFKKNKTIPTLKNPNNHLEATKSDGEDKHSDKSYSDHSHQVGHIYKEVTHVKQSAVQLKNEIAQENKIIYKEQLDMSVREQVERTTLDGLFSTRFKDSSLIQPKPIVPNFFNPYRLLDQVLFKEKQHTYMNCAIFRDISASTDGTCHTLMEHITAKLIKDIPVDTKYYLYASGHVSVIEVPYVPWLNSHHTPSEYKDLPLFKQLGGGTNSDAIADVITEQMSDKYLNIIITDGDLDQLMKRSNIAGLLKNVFVIAVETDLEDITPHDLLGITIKNSGDIERIYGVLNTINMVE